MISGSSGSGEVLHFMHTFDYAAIVDPLNAFSALDSEFVFDAISSKHC